MAASQKKRQFMIAQQVSHLDSEILSNIPEIIESLNPEIGAWIIHDKDVNDNGQLIEPHVHIALKFANPRSIANIGKAFQIETQYVEVWSGTFNNALSYLTHRTDKAMDKYQYELSDVHTSDNFDYITAIENIMAGVSRSSEATDNAVINEALDNIKAGTITSELDLYHQLPGHLYSRYHTVINTAFTMKAKDDADKWRQAKIESGESIKVLWFYGAAGLGKSRLAKILAAQFSKDGRYFKTGSSKDPFQGYSGESSVIMDELRPRQSMTYSDLLTILDPFDVTSRAPARFKDPNLVADYFIVTSPFDPKTFFEGMKTDEIDKFDQLLRRISKTFYVTVDYVFDVQFDDQAEMYQPIEKNTKQNTWNYKSKFVQSNEDEDDHSLDNIIPSDDASTAQGEQS